MDTHKEWMQIAIGEARKGVERGAGGPFGAVLVKDGSCISRTHNRVLVLNDPTAHAEVLAIQEASRKLRRFDLSDCVVYSSCEPCPMCLSALYWARIKVLYYGCTREDAEKIGFSDRHIYDVLSGEKKGDITVYPQFNREDALSVFQMWRQKEDRVLY